MKVSIPVRYWSSVHTGHLSCSCRHCSAVGYSTLTRDPSEGAPGVRTSTNPTEWGPLGWGRCRFPASTGSGCQEVWRTQNRHITILPIRLLLPGGDISFRETS